MAEGKIAEVKSDGEQSSIKISNVGGKLSISGNVRVLSVKTAAGFSCYVTGFDIYFAAKDDETKKKKALTFVKFYLDNFMLFSGKNNIRKLVMNLNKKGFRADNHNAVMFELVNNKIVKANFKTVKPLVPTDFVNADAFSEKFEVAA